MVIDAKQIVNHYTIVITILVFFYLGFGITEINYSLGDIKVNFCFCTFLLIAHA